MLETKQTTIKIGYHTDKLPSLYATINNVNENADCVQIFTGSPRSYFHNFKEEDVLRTHKLLVKRNMRLYVHAPYLINLAGTSDPRNMKYEENLKKSQRALTEQLVNVSKLDGSVVVHIGACSNTDLGLDNIAYNVIKSLKKSIEKLESSQYIPRLLLENAAGEKNKLGSDMIQISHLLDKVEMYAPDLKSYLNLCMDTCHLHSAGYDLSLMEGIDNWYHIMSDINLLHRVKLFHFNDSDTSWNSGVDRHRVVKRGCIFKDDNFEYFVSLSKKHGIDLLLEESRGRDDTDMKRCFKLLKEMRNNQDKV